MTSVGLTANRQKAGWGELQVVLVNGQSSAVSVEAHNPIKLLVPRPRGQSVWAYLSNYGGGFLPGDQMNVAVNVDSGAACFLGTQSSTRIYQAGARGPVRSQLHARVGNGATLVYAPDVAQSFASARYQQKQTFCLADKSSSLVFLDWYSSGRVARGERWQFSEYCSQTEIRVADRLVFWDSLHLQDGLPDLPSRMGRINCVATLVSIPGEPIASEKEFKKQPHVLCVSSPIPNGTVTRIASTSVDLAAEEIQSRLTFINQRLGDDPFLRKW